MVAKSHMFEDDIDIIETVENEEVVYLAFVRGKVLKKYPSAIVKNPKTAMEMAVSVLSRQTLQDDFLDIVCWLDVAHPDLSSNCSIAIARLYS